jgi:hypothetical protein
VRGCVGYSFEIAVVAGLACFVGAAVALPSVRPSARVALLGIGAVIGSALVARLVTAGTRG